MLVVRLPEMYLPIVRFRPSIVVGSIVGILLMQRVGAGAWRAVFEERAVRWLALYVVAILVTIPFALWPGGAFNVVYILPFVSLMFVTIMLCQPTRETLDKVIRWTVVFGGIYAAYILAFGSIVMDASRRTALGRQRHLRSERPCRTRRHGFAARARVESCENAAAGG